MVAGPGEGGHVLKLSRMAHVKHAFRMVIGLKIRFLRAKFGDGCFRLQLGPVWGVQVANRKNQPEKTHLEHTQEEDIGHVHTHT